jgi:hypothetical protein
MTTNLYIGDHVFNLETLVFGYKIYDQAYFDLNLLITLIFFSIYKAYYISNQKQKKVDIFKFFKDEINNVFDTNIFRQVKTGNFISKAHVYLTRIIQSLYYSPASRCINAWMHSLKKSVKLEIVNRYDLWVLQHKIGGAKVFVNNVQWSDQMM